MNNGRHILAWTLLLIAAAYLCYRGVYRAAVDPGGDFITLSTGAAVWFDGGNPYDQDELADRFVARGGDEWSHQPQITTPMLWTVLWPVGKMPWPAARWAWLAANMAATMAVIGIAVRWVGLSFRRPAHVCAIALLVALAPFQSCLTLGQMGTVSVMLVMLAIIAERGNRHFWAGLAIAMAIAFKPTVAGLFLVYWLLSRRWRAFVWGVGWTAGIAVIAIGWMVVHHVPWYDGWQQNMHVFHDGVGNPRKMNILLNAALGLATFIPNDIALKVLVYVLCLTPLAVLAVRRPSDDDPASPWGALALVSLVSLLVVYHRIYDAALLVFVWGWAVQSIRAGRRIGWVAIALLLPFLVNGTAVAYAIHTQRRLPLEVTTHAMWRVLVWPHLTWALLALLYVVTWCVWRQPRRTLATARDR